MKDKKDSQTQEKQVLTQADVSWNCRFHPTDWWHEIGCSHQKWTVEQLLSALITKKKFEEDCLKQMNIDLRGEASIYV